MNGSRVADAFEANQDELLRLWQSLDHQGPTFGSEDAGNADEARDRYLRPLARVLIGGLRGSADHAAVYLDERLRYLPGELSAAQKAIMLRSALAVEIPALAALVEPGLPAEDTEQALWAAHAELLGEQESTARLLFVGDCVFVETRAFLTPLARRRAHPVDVTQAFFSARQPLDSRNTAIVDLVAKNRPDLIGISLFTFEGIPPYQAAWQQAALPVVGRRALDLADSLVQVLGETIDDIRAVSDCTIVVHSPGGLPLDKYRRRLPFFPAHSRTQRALLRRLSEGVRELVDATVNTLVLDEADLVRRGGGPRRANRPAFDPTDVPYGYFHATRLGAILAAEYDGILADWALLGRTKAVFVDFDNTLWSGVMGEGPVTHDQRAQRLLQQLRHAGVVLVALSKNDPSSIRWDEMILQEDDFAALKINWRPKPDNVSEAVRELDLAPSAFILLDDNPAERALVTETVPGVRALDPAEVGTWRALQRWLDFPSTTQTEEARRRTQMYREAAQRRAALNVTHDYASMMSTLHLVYDVRFARRNDVPRLLELIQRTNQFNTTTRRRSVTEIEAILDTERFGVYVATLEDRFGDLGVVAVAVFDRPRGTFDSVIMSCRAMGFGLETAVLSRVIESEGAAEVRAEFIATDRNAPASALFSNAGFEESEPGLWVLAADAPRPRVPSWFA